MKDSSGIRSARSCQIFAVAAFILLLQSASATSSSDHQAGIQCHAQWRLVSRHRNALDHSVMKTVTRFTGVVRSGQDSSSKKTSAEDGFVVEGSLSYKIVGISASYRSSSSNEETVTHLRGTQLTESAEIRREFTVSPGTTVTVWQLVGTFGGTTVQFEDFEFLKGSAPPQSEATCRLHLEWRKSITTQVATTRITSDTLVRLKHRATGQYLYAINFKRDRWQSVTLSDSQESHFRLVRDNSNEYVRIVTAQPIWWGSSNGGYDYRYAYCSHYDQVYFDEWSYNGKQLWRMSITDPVDGDVVTFRNKYYRHRGLSYTERLIYHTGGYGAPAYVNGSKFEFCSNENLHEWVIEVVR